MEDKLRERAVEPFVMAAEQVAADHPSARAYCTALWLNVRGQSSSDITQLAGDETNTTSKDSGIAPHGYVAGALPEGNKDPLDKLYLDWLQTRSEMDDELRLSRLPSDAMKEKLHHLCQQAIQAKFCLDEHDQNLRQIASADHLKLTVAHNSNGIVGLGPTTEAYQYGSSIPIEKPRSVDLYGSALSKDTTNYASSVSTNKFSHYESAPGPGFRWRRRLSADRNCGFGGRGISGHRKDAVEAEEARLLKEFVDQAFGGKQTQKSRIQVPTGLQEAMRKGSIRKGQPRKIGAKKSGNGNHHAKALGPNDEDDCVTEDEDEDSEGGDNGWYKQHQHCEDGGGESGRLDGWFETDKRWSNILLV